MRNSSMLNAGHPLLNQETMGKLFSLEDQITNNKYDLHEVEEIIKIYSVI